MAVYLLATLDTKGDEAAFVRDELRREGVEVVLVDTGCLGLAKVAADVAREDVFRAAGTTLEALQQGNDRGEAVTAAARGAEAIAVACTELPLLAALEDYPVAAFDVVQLHVEAALDRAMASG